MPIVVDSKVLVIETDASDYGGGSVIYQVGADKVIEPITFMVHGVCFEVVHLQKGVLRRVCQHEGI
jgi:hypothetical protein